MPAEHNSTSIVDSGIHKWNSPLPYLFGGLAIMLGLIAFALIMLAWSHKKYPGSHPSANDDQEKPTRADVLRPEMEPRIVVIMAGDNNPTYLAKPTASCIRHSEEV